MSSLSSLCSNFSTLVLPEPTRSYIPIFLLPISIPYPTFYIRSFDLWSVDLWSVDYFGILCIYVYLFGVFCGWYCERTVNIYIVYSNICLCFIHLCLSNEYWTVVMHGLSDITHHTTHNKQIVRDDEV